MKISEQIFGNSYSLEISTFINFMNIKEKKLVFSYQMPAEKVIYIQRS